MSFIHKNCIIGETTIIKNGVNIDKDVVIGENCVIYPFASIGTSGQNKFTSENPNATKTIIGNNTIIREGVTINAPIENKTIIGNDCYLMATSHVGHDGILGNNVTLTNSANIAGHSQIGDNAVLGLNCAIHQHKVIGCFCMIGMLTPITNHLPPFTVAYGNPARWYKINELGMKRGGLSQEIIDFVKGFYKNYSDFDRDASKISNKFIRDIFREYYKKIGSEKEVPYGGSY